MKIASACWKLIKSLQHLRNITVLNNSQSTTFQIKLPYLFNGFILSFFILLTQRNIILNFAVNILSLLLKKYKKKENSEIFARLTNTSILNGSCLKYGDMTGLSQHFVIKCNFGYCKHCNANFKAQIFRKIIASVP